MCGIVGYVGTGNNATSVLITGLLALEYRGYDSAGVCIEEDGTRFNVKAKGKVKNLEMKLEDANIKKGSLGIAHTRWATHGKPTEDNAHPHKQGIVTLVHNGIIENDDELREELKKKGYVFQSETDTEIAAACIDDCTKQTSTYIEALRLASTRLKGSYAFGVMFENDKHLYAMRRNSPLIIAIGEHENYIASDIPAVLAYTKKYMLLDQDDIACLSDDEIHVYDASGKEVEREVLIAEMEVSNIQKNGYDHFMMKEMMEESEVVMNTLHQYVKKDVQELEKTLPDFSKYKEIHIVSCGSALYAGMIGKSIIEQYARIRVEVEVASEYRYKQPMFNKETLVLVISQSGETADTLAAIALAKEHGIDTYAIVNVIGSSIAREATFVSYTYAGVEVAVATTKAYLCQVALLSLVCIKLCMQHNTIEKHELQAHIDELLRCKPILEKQLEENNYIDVATSIYEHEHVFFIGRGKDYAMCLEGSLKLKEISYIHSEAYAAGELKHGTISLIEDGTPVLCMCSDETIFEKTISNMKEVKARGAYVIAFIREGLEMDEGIYDKKVVLPKVHPLLQPLVSVIPLQRISYEVAKLRGCEIDQPKNLAKSVTVE